MAEPTPLENALYRMRSYQGLLAGDIADKPQSAAADLKILLDWIDCARPLLGAVTPQPAGDFLDQPRRAYPASTPPQPSSAAPAAAPSAAVEPPPGGQTAPAVPPPEAPKAA